VNVLPDRLTETGCGPIGITLIHDCGDAELRP